MYIYVNKKSPNSNLSSTVSIVHVYINYLGVQLTSTPITVKPILNYRDVIMKLMSIITVLYGDFVLTYMYEGACMTVCISICVCVYMCVYMYMFVCVCVCLCVSGVY